MSTKTIEPGFYWGRVRQGLIPLGEPIEWEPVKVMMYGGRLVVVVLGDDREVELADMELGERLVHGATAGDADAGA